MISFMKSSLKIVWKVKKHFFIKQDISLFLSKKIYFLFLEGKVFFKIPKNSVASAFFFFFFFFFLPRQTLKNRHASTKPTAFTNCRDKFRMLEACLWNFLKSVSHPFPLVLIPWPFQSGSYFIYWLHYYYFLCLNRSIVSKSSSKSMVVELLFASL